MGDKQIALYNIAQVAVEATEVVSEVTYVPLPFSFSLAVDDEATKTMKAQIAALEDYAAKTMKAEFATLDGQVAEQNARIKTLERIVWSLQNKRYA